MSSPAQQGPINLTAIAEPMPWPEARKVVRVFALSNGVALEIRGLDDVEAGHSSAGFSDNVDTAGEFTYAGLGFIRAVNGDRRVWARGSPISQ
jgi:hypothetical protein